MKILSNKNYTLPKKFKNHWSNDYNPIRDTNLCVTEEVTFLNPHLSIGEFGIPEILHYP